MVILINIIIILLTLSSVVGGHEEEMLIKSVIPIQYEITIAPELSNLSFNGETILTIIVEEIIENITLNSKNLEFTNITILSSNSNSTDADEINFELNPDSEVLTLYFSNQLLEGLYDITFRYTGTINENHQGLYISQYYKTVDGVMTERPFLLTNFQYTNARQVFPCFDHPTFPATYSVNVVRPNDYVSISNTAKISEEVLINEGKSIDKFAKSDMMPTYLVSFAVIDFEHITNEISSIYTTSQEGTELIIELIRKTSEKFIELYPYKLDKINYVIVPDYSISENVLESIGFIVFRRSAVAFTQNKASSKDKEIMLKLIAHAVAKQTNKNMDTSKWWTHFWLNEGILSLYQYEICGSLEPEWQILEQFIVKELQDTLHFDTEEGEIAVTLNENESPDNLSLHFYTKSFSLIRMLVSLELPGDITTVSDNSAAAVWGNFKGYPVLYTNRSGVNNIKIYQDGSRLTSVPFNIATEKKTNFDDPFSTFVLNEAEQEFNISLTNYDEWYIITKQQTGYFRVSYSVSDSLLIANYLKTDKFNKIKPIARAQIIDDLYNLAYLGIASYDIYLDTIKYLTREEDFIPLYTFFKTTSHLKNLLAHSEVQEKFLNYARGLVFHLYENVGTEVYQNDSHIDKLKRINLLTWLCSFNDERCQRRMYEILSENKEVDSDIKEAVYCGGMRLGNIENFEFLLHQYQKSGDVKILRYMACTSNSEILRYYLEAIINRTIIVHINAEHSLDAVLNIVDGSDTGVDTTLDFIKQYLDQVLENFDDDKISEIFIALSKKLMTVNHLEKINEIISCLTDVSKIRYEKLFEQVKKNIQKNITWRNAYLRVIDNYLDNAIITTSTSRTTPTDEATTTSFQDEKTPSTDLPGSAATARIYLHFLMITCIVIFCY